MKRSFLLVFSTIFFHLHGTWLLRVEIKGVGGIGRIRGTCPQEKISALWKAKAQTATILRLQNHIKVNAQFSYHDPVILTDKKPAKLVKPWWIRYSKPTTFSLESHTHVLIIQGTMELFKANTICRYLLGAETGVCGHFVCRLLLSA